MIEDPPTTGDSSATRWTSLLSPPRPAADHPRRPACRVNGLAGRKVWTQHGDDYFERDSLAALSTVLTQLRTITTLDDAIAMLRRGHPYPQHLVTVTHPMEVVLDRLRHALPPTWRRDGASAGLVVFQRDPYGHIAVRTSGTEAATRLYIEAPAQILERLTSALAEPCPAIGRLSTQE